MSTLGTENPQEPVHPTSYGRPDSPVNEPPPTGTVNKVRGFVNEKATSFVGFFRTIYGILNIVIIVCSIFYSFKRNIISLRTCYRLQLPVY